MVVSHYSKISLQREANIILKLKKFFSEINLLWEPEEYTHIYTHTDVIEEE